jgi:hypothetical protein
VFAQPETPSVTREATEARSRRFTGESSGVSVPAAWNQ